MFSPTVGKSKCLYALSGMPYLYDVDKPETYGVLNQILQDSGTKVFKTDKTGTVPGKLRCMGSLTMI
jgi:hypothetical protein